MDSMKHLINILEGAARALDFLPKSRRYIIDSRGFETDAQHLRNDFQSIGRNMRAQLKRESANYRTR